MILFRSMLKRVGESRHPCQTPTGVNNIPVELVQAGGEDVITALTTICNKIWQTGEWPTPWTQSIVITLSKKGNLQQCQNYQTISFNSRPSKVMLKIIPNRWYVQHAAIWHWYLLLCSYSFKFFIAFVQFFNFFLYLYFFQIWYG